MKTPAFARGVVDPADQRSKELAQIHIAVTSGGPTPTKCYRRRRASDLSTPMRFYDQHGPVVDNTRAAWAALVEVGLPHSPKPA